MKEKEHLIYTNDAAPSESWRHQRHEIRIMAAKVMWRNVSMTQWWQYEERMTSKQ